MHGTVEHARQLLGFKLQHVDFQIQSHEKQNAKYKPRKACLCSR